MKGKNFEQRQKKQAERDRIAKRDRNKNAKSKHGGGGKDGGKFTWGNPTEVIQ